MSVIQLGRGRISAWSQIWRLQHDRNANSLRHALLSPLPQHLFNFACDLLACFGAVHTARQQLIVWSVVVANGGAHARIRAFSLRFRPASERPTRPLPRTTVCSAMAAT